MSLANLDGGRLFVAIPLLASCLGVYWYGLLNLVDELVCGIVVYACFEAGWILGGRKSAGGGLNAIGHVACQISSFFCGALVAALMRPMSTEQAIAIGALALGFGYP